MLPSRDERGRHHTPPNSPVSGIPCLRTGDLAAKPMVIDYVGSVPLVECERHPFNRVLGVVLLNRIICPPKPFRGNFPTGSKRLVRIRPAPALLVLVRCRTGAQSLTWTHLSHTAARPPNRVFAHVRRESISRRKSLQATPKSQQAQMTGQFLQGAFEYPALRYRSPLTIRNCSAHGLSLKPTICCASRS